MQSDSPSGQKIPVRVTARIVIPIRQVHTSRPVIVASRSQNDKHTSSTNVCTNVSICYLNARSIRNKTLSIADYVTSYDYDIVCLSETWLSSDTDTSCEMVPTGYAFNHVLRNTGRSGGGVAVLFKAELPITVLMSSNNDNRDVTHFEYLDCRVEYNGAAIRLVVVYRPQRLHRTGSRRVCSSVSGHYLLNT